MLIRRRGRRRRCIGKRVWFGIRLGIKRIELRVEICVKVVSLGMDVGGSLVILSLTPELTSGGYVCAMMWLECASGNIKFDLLINSALDDCIPASECEQHPLDETHFHPKCSTRSSRDNNNSHSCQWQRNNISTHRSKKMQIPRVGQTFS